MFSSAYVPIDEFIDVDRPYTKSPSPAVLRWSQNGHTPSRLGQPARTISCRNPVRGGANYWLNAKGQLMMLTTTEAARLQCLRDDQHDQLVGSNQSVWQQIGNGVPVLLAEVLGRQIVAALS